MLRFGFLTKNLFRAISVIKHKDIVEKSMIDMQFSNAKDLNSFLQDIDTDKLSLSMLAYSLKISKNNFQHLSFESMAKVYQIRDEIERNLDKLDTQSIINYCEWFGKSDFIEKQKFPQECKEIVVSRINDLILSSSLDRRQILTIYENLLPQGIRIKELEYEVQKVANNPSTLTLEEISQIIAGSNKWIYDSRANLFYSCMNRIFQLSKEEELDGRYLAKILDIFATYKKERGDYKKYIIKLVNIIENTLPRWKEEDLLSIVKLSKSYDDFKRERFYVLTLINNRLSNEQPIEFLIKLTSLLKEETKKNPFNKEIVSKSLDIIKVKLSGSFVGQENLSNILDLMKPIVDSRTGHLLEKLINYKNEFYYRKIELFQKASWIYVNDEGNLSPLAEFIPMNIRYKWIQDLRNRYKVNQLIRIVNTKNYEFYGLQEIKNQLINDLKKWIISDYKNVKNFCAYLIDKDYSSKLVKALKPLQDTVYSLLQKQCMQRFCILYSMQFYESDKKKWEDFVIENKNSFSSDGILHAIRFYEGPFGAIIYLFDVYKNNISRWWIDAAMRRIIKVQDANLLNDFARILNRMDPHHLLESSSATPDCLYHLFIHSNFTLLTDLFFKAQKILKDLPIDTIFSNNNIQILSFAARLGKLDSELADKIASNYDYMRNTDYWRAIVISSKCSDEKLRESIVKRVFNDKLGNEHIMQALEIYRYHPKNKEIDIHIIEFMNKNIPNLKGYGIYCMDILFSKYSETDRNNHFEIFNTMKCLTKDLILKNIPLLRLVDIESLLSLAEKQILKDFDFAEVIWKSQKLCMYAKNEEAREKTIDKIATVGLSDKKAVLAICSEKDNFSSGYLARTISCLADLRLDIDEEIKDMANNLIDYAEDKKLVFENDTEYINWIYGLISFNANKSVIMRHLENSKYFDIEKPIFKHFLLANHFSLDPNYKEISILEQKTEKYWRDFDYFKHFGIDKPLIGHIKTLFNKANLEVKSGEFIDGIWVPFYIPSRKAALWPITNSILLYNSMKFRGEFIMHQKQLIKKTKDLIILNSEETSQIEKIDIGKLLNI